MLKPIEYLVENFGVWSDYFKPDNQEITADQVKNALREDTILVSTMYVNNETGTSFYQSLILVHSAAYHVDAVQAVGKLEILPKN